ncbi:MAG: hypothetical protein II861_06675 [Methanomicrobium sp.]|nr:hypothetical protein [Methanomicrobium sp.]
MTDSEEDGHFVNGVWVKNSEAEQKDAGASSGKCGDPDFDKIVNDATASLKATVDNLVNRGNELLNSEEKRAELESKAIAAGHSILKSFENVVKDAKKTLEDLEKKN